MAQGLYHPNYRHGLGTYYPELEDINHYETADNKLNDYGSNQANSAHADNMVQRYKRLEAGSVDPENVKKYREKLKYWEDKRSDQVDKRKENYIILYRKNRNTGAFSELLERMSKKHIRSVAQEYGVSLKGIKLNIDANEEFLNLTLAGMANFEKIGNITFFPNAFKNKEELLRTLIHEKAHVEQYKKYGVNFVQSNHLMFEKEAYRIEDNFIKDLKERGVL